MTLPPIPCVAPSILAADFAHLARDVAAVESAGASLLHVDVMDGRYVPNITIGVPVVRCLRKATALPLDVHLMIVEPERYVPAFREAGADMISVHVEACPHLHSALALIRAQGALAGVAVNPGSTLHFLDEVADLLDYLLVMSVNPGFGGQTFIRRSLHKVSDARRRLDAAGASRVVVEVDGGIDAKNAAALVRAGAGILVCGSSVFGKPDPEKALREIARAMTRKRR